MLLRFVADYRPLNLGRQEWRMIYPPCFSSRPLRGSVFDVRQLILAPASHGVASHLAGALDFCLKVGDGTPCAAAYRRLRFLLVFIQFEISIWPPTYPVEVRPIWPPFLIVQIRDGRLQSAQIVTGAIATWVDGSEKNAQCGYFERHSISVITNADDVQALAGIQSGIVMVDCIQQTAVLDCII